MSSVMYEGLPRLAIEIGGRVGAMRLEHSARNQQARWSRRRTTTLLVYAPTSLAILVAGVLLRSGEARASAVLGLGAVGVAGIWLLSWMAAAGKDEISGSASRYLAVGFTILFAAEAAGEGLAQHVLGLEGALNVLWRGVWMQWLVTLGIVAAMQRLRDPGKRAENGRDEYERFLAAAENTLDDFYIFDGVADATGQIVDFRFNYLNPNAERRLGWKREELAGKILTEVRPFMVQSGLIEKYCEVVRTGNPYTCEVFLDDEIIRSTWLNVQVVKLGDGIAVTSRDVTERKRLTDQVSYLAHHDPLTGLPNRAMLLESLHKAIAVADTEMHQVAVFLVDIDFFKRINDTLGHASGDAVLQAVGERLRLAIRDSDTVARLGGDEFVVVMPNIRSMDDVRMCARKLIESASQPVAVGPRKIEITMSLGVSLYPDHGKTPSEVLHAADAAMYSMKDTGRNGLRVFHPEDMDRGMELADDDAAVFGSTAWSSQRWERWTVGDGGQPQVEGLED